MDLGLPELDGLETMRRIRANEAFLDVPIIVLTAYLSSFQHQAALSAGGNFVLEKPVDFEELEKLIHNIMKNRFRRHRGRLSSITNATAVASSFAYRSK